MKTQKQIQERYDKMRIRIARLYAELCKDYQADELKQIQTLINQCTNYCDALYWVLKTNEYEGSTIDN